MSVKVTGGGSNTTKQTTIGNIAGRRNRAPRASLSAPSPSGSALTIEVKVAPVVGEHVTTNNNATYNVTFSVGAGIRP